MVLQAFGHSLMVGPELLADGKVESVVHEGTRSPVHEEVGPSEGDAVAREVYLVAVMHRRTRPSLVFDDGPLGRS